MRLILTNYKVRKMEADGGHSYMTGRIDKINQQEEIHIYLTSSHEEKKLFPNSRIDLEGEFIEGDRNNPHHLLNTKIHSCLINSDIPLEGLTVKNRLMATGLIHEFTNCFRKDKMRALEILKALGVSEKYAEEILLRNSYILPFL